MKHTSFAILPIALAVACGAPEQKAEHTVDTATANPLAAKSTLVFQAPLFNLIKDSDYEPAIEAGMKKQLEEVRVIVENKEAPSFENTIVAMEKSGQLLDRASNVFFNLVGTDKNPARAALEVEYAPKFAAAGAVVIDNSSTFRYDDDVPLVVSEVNPQEAHNRPRGIIANPNCSTIILLMALTPLRRAFGVESAIVSTYQAASGAGARGVEELEAQTRADLGGEVVRAGAETGGLFHEPYAFNLFSHNAPVDGASGSNGEETKMLLETRKIWEDPRVRVSATCIRVPVRRAHSESVHVVLERGATRAEVLGALGSFAGLRVVDDRAANRFPTPLKASGQDEVLVGRVRASVVQPGEEAAEGGPADVRDDRRAWRAWDLFVCGDQLLKGAALNAVQIAEVLVRGK